MYILGWAEFLEGVVSGLDEVGLCERHDACRFVMARSYISLYAEHESWVANLYFESFVELICYIF